MSKDKLLQIRVDDKTYKQLERIANIRKTTKSEAIRDLINSNKYEKVKLKGDFSEIYPLRYWEGEVNAIFDMPTQSFYVIDLTITREFLARHNILYDFV